MSKVWLNGEIMESTQARIDPADRGFLLGAGLFETVLVRDGKPVFEREHLERLSNSATTLRITLPLSLPAMSTALRETIAANDLRDNPRASLRITLTQGTGPRGLLSPIEQKPTLLIAAFGSAAPVLTATAITSHIRRNEMSPVANLKTLPYLDQVLARTEAQDQGADAAIFLNTKDKVCCATAANIFLWDSSTLLTPPLSDGCLDGITRRKLIETANTLSIPVYEESISPSTLANVESVFLTNALVGIQSLTHLDGRALKEHDATTRLRAALDMAESASIQ